MARKRISSLIDFEEVLLDAGVYGKEEGGVLESPINNRKFFIFFVLSFSVLGLLFGRAFWLETVRGDYYTKKSQNNTIRTYQTPGPRGLIYDRFDKLLVENLPGFDLLVLPVDLPRTEEGLEEWAETISFIIGVSKEGVRDFLNSLDLSSPTPVLMFENIDEKQILVLETQKTELSGLLINEVSFRNYINGPIFSHIIGYTSKVSKDDLKKDNSYNLTDDIGITGAEYQYEKELRGVKGIRAIIVDSKGIILRQAQAQETESGKTLKLTIWANLQKKVYEFLNDEMAATLTRGAGAVVMNPKNGEVLALISLPSFDNNLFSRSISPEEYRKLTENKARPFFNRITSGNYPSGSTIKPLIAAAALEEKIIDPRRLVDDTLGYITIPHQFDPKIKYIFHDWKAHGWVDMRKAIAVSANVYFYTIGGGYGDIKGLGINLINKYLNLFGLGRITGIDLPSESKGLVPSPEWKKAVKNQGWFLGDTYNVSIGQGDLMVSPLQLAGAIAAVANGGTLFQPQIIKEIIQPSGQIVNKFNPKILQADIVSPQNLEIVREGMRQAVSEGSARFLADLPQKAAGKTGTAQFGREGKANAWFVGFAPYDDPQLVVAIVMEGAGQGSTVAVPIAKRIFEWYFLQTEK